MKKLLVICCIASALLLTSCASAAKARAKHAVDCSDKIHQAIVKFEKKKYASSQFLLSEVMEKCPGSMSQDTVLLYLGKSWLGMKKPEEAKTEFSRLVRSFPASPLAEEAYFLVGYSAFRASNPSHLDQTSTREAMQTLGNVIDRYPGSRYADSAKIYAAQCADKLAEKEFSNACFYESVNRYESAIVYFKYIIEEFPSGSLVTPSKLHLARALFKLNRNDEAVALLDQIIEQSDDKTAVKEAQVLKARNRQ
jgi:outer membrane protein assembly factor BamD